MADATGRGHKPVTALPGSAGGFPCPALSASIWRASRVEVTSPLRRFPGPPAVFRGRPLPRQLADFRGYGRALAAAETFALGLAAEAFTLGLAAGVAAPLGWVVGWTLG